MSAASRVVRRAVPDAPDREQENARMRALLSGPNPGPVGERIALLHFTGRRTGRAYTVPAGVHELAGDLVVATGSAWRHNFAGGADGELTWRSRREAARFTLVEDQERIVGAYLTLFDRYGFEAAQRRLGIVATRPPTRAEMLRAVVEDGLSLVEVERGHLETSPLGLPRHGEEPRA